MDGRSYRTFRSRSSFDPYDDANEDYDETGYYDGTEDYDATDGYDCPPAETEDSDDESATENDDCLPAVTEDWKERQSTELSHSQAVGGSTTTALPVDTPLYATPAYSPVMTPATPAAPAASERSGIVPRLHNVVASVDLGCKLDLKAIVLRARNAEYTPKRFAAVIMRIQEPRTTALIFGSGKMVCAGAKSEEQSRLAARKFARLVQKMGFPVKFIGFKIQNMVASCDVRFPIEIEGLFLGHQQFSSYEPEIFPGLIYRMVKPRVVLLIFVSGKLVLTGAKVRGDIYEAFENIYPILKNVRKTT